MSELQQDVLDLLEGRRRGHMGKHMYKPAKPWQKVARKRGRYYIPWADSRTLRENADDIAKYIPKGTPIIVLGAGDEQAFYNKSLFLAKKLGSKKGLVIDGVSLFREQAQAMAKCEKIDIATADDFNSDWENNMGPALAFMGGCSYGNISRENRVTALKTFFDKSDNGWILFSVDANKNPAKACSMYSDEWIGEFVKNLFTLMEKELKIKGLKKSNWSYKRVWDPDEEGTEHVLVANREHTITLNGKKYLIPKGHEWHIETSRKLTPAEAENDILLAGGTVQAVFQSHPLSRHNQAPVYYILAKANAGPA